MSTAGDAVTTSRPRDPVLLRGDWQRHLPNVWVMYIFRALRLRRRRRPGHSFLGLPGPGTAPQTHPRRHRRGRPAYDRDRSAPDFRIGSCFIATMRGGPELTVTADPSGLLPAEYISHAISFDTLRVPCRPAWVARSALRSTTSSRPAIRRHRQRRHVALLRSSCAPSRHRPVDRHSPDARVPRWYVAKDRLYEAIGALKRVV